MRSVNLNQRHLSMALGTLRGAAGRPNVLKWSWSVEADSDTQKVLERLIAALEKQGFKIVRKDKE